LNGAIEVLVIDSVLIVPNAGSGTRYFVAHKQNAIVSRIRFELGNRRSRPGVDSWLHSHRGSGRRKCEIGNPAHVIPAVGSVVVHVALARMRLAPGVFMRRDVCCFGEIGRARIERCVQIIDLNNDPVRYAVVHMAAVVVRVWVRGEEAGERIDPGARAQVGPRVKTGIIGV